jgi:hypothetical protein
LDRVGTPFELPWNRDKNLDVSAMEKDPENQEYVYGWRIVYPGARDVLGFSTQRLRDGQPPLLRMTAAHDMAHCTRALMAGCAGKDANNNIFDLTTSMYAQESERADTWQGHFGWVREKFTGGYNNEFCTAILDENVSGMRMLAKELPRVELFRCSVHRSKTVAKGGKRGDKRAYEKFAKALASPLQINIYNGFSATLRRKVDLVPWSEQSLASKSRDGYILLFIQLHTALIRQQVRRVHGQQRRVQVAHALRRAPGKPRPLAHVHRPDGHNAAPCLEAAGGRVARLREADAVRQGRARRARSKSDGLEHGRRRRLRARPGDRQSGHGLGTCLRRRLKALMLAVPVSSTVPPPRPHD